MKERDGERRVEKIEGEKRERKRERKREEIQNNKRRKLSNFGWD